MGHSKCNLLLTQARPRMIQYLTSITVSVNKLWFCEFELRRIHFNLVLVIKVIGLFHLMSRISLVLRPPAPHLVGKLEREKRKEGLVNRHTTLCSHR